MLKINVTKVAHFSGHRDCIYALEFSLHENCFYSGASEGYVVEWNTETRGDGKLIVNIKKPIYSLLLDNNFKQLFCGTSTGNLHIIDLKENREIKNIEAHSLGLFDIKLLDEHFITSGGDGIIKIWNLQDFTLLKSIKASDKSARVIAINDVTKEFAVGFSDWRISIFNSENFTLNKTLESHTNSVFSICYSPNGNYLLSGGRDAILKVWDIKNNYQLILEIPAHTLQIKCVAYNPTGNLFATVSMDKTIKIWDADNFELLKVIDHARNDSHINSINKLVWVNDTNFITCSDDKQIMVWEVGII